MFLRSTVSAIASASMKSFLFEFTKGFTNWAGINRTSCPCLRSARPRKWGAGGRLQVDQRGLHVRGVSQQPLLRELLPRKHLAGCAECYKVKGRLAKVDAN